MIIGALITALLAYLAAKKAKRSLLRPAGLWSTNGRYIAALHKMQLFRSRNCNEPKRNNLTKPN
jgi:hypothetical protein